MEHNLGQKGPSPNSQHPKYSRSWFPGPKKVGTRSFVLDVLLEASIMEEAGRFEDLLRPLIRSLG